MGYFLLRRSRIGHKIDSLKFLPTTTGMQKKESLSLEDKICNDRADITFVIKDTFNVCQLDYSGI